VEVDAEETERTNQENLLTMKWINKWKNLSRFQKMLVVGGIALVSIPDVVIWTTLLRKRIMKHHEDEKKL
jgi:hypothetical protein